MTTAVSYIPILELHEPMLDDFFKQYPLIPEIQPECSN
jgi:hypothetical protein